MKPEQILEIADKNERVWRDIKGYEQKYVVSNQGDVLSWARGKLLKQHINNRGYYAVGLYKNNKRKTYQVHALVLESFIKRPKGKEPNHKNSIRADNRLENLEWLTRSENISHGYRNGRNSGKKLDSVTVRAMRAQHKQGWSQAEIAKKYGISSSTMSNIINRKLWKYV